MDFLTMSISSSGSWTSVERIMSGTRHPIRFVIEANFFLIQCNIELSHRVLLSVLC